MIRITTVRTALLKARDAGAITETEYAEAFNALTSVWAELEHTLHELDYLVKGED